MTLGKQAGMGRTFGNGANAWSVVHIDDLGDLYARAVERAPAGTVLHGAAGEPVRMIDIAAAISRTLGAGERTEPIPLAEARRRYPFANALAADKRIDAAQTSRLLGWAPRGPSLSDEIERGSYTPLLVGPVVDGSQR